MISNKIVKASYLGNGVTRQWGIPFSYTDTSQICVALLENDVQTILDSNDYTVNTGSGVVVYPKTNDDPPIAAGVVLVVFRDTDITQLSDLTNQGGAWPETIENSLDKLTQIAQEQGEALERSVKVYISSDEKPEELITNLYEKAAEATASASAAAISETNAYNSEIAASASAAAAYNSEVAAGNSATAAGNSATAAGISETNAGNSATAAHNSEVAAAASELAAGNSATAALNSELAAGASETNAGNSATASYNSEVAAASSANSAAASASEAAGYAHSVDFRALLRQPSTAYVLGAVVYLPSMGAAMYLECTTAGTTDSGDLVISTPTPNDTVNDGSVVWTIKKAGSDPNALTREITPAFNTRDVITTSGTYTAPVTGWYKITAKGGGGGGAGSTDSSSNGHISASGGGEGGTTLVYEHLNAGDTVMVVIGAGGAGGVAGASGVAGGDTSVTIADTPYMAYGGGAGSVASVVMTGGAGGDGTIKGINGEGGFMSYTIPVAGRSGGGAGGGSGVVSQDGTAGTKGGGGAGGGTGSKAGGAGGDGFVWFEYFATI